MKPIVEGKEAIIDNEIEGICHCLFVCGLETTTQQDAIILEGFVDIRSFGELRSKDNLQMVKTMNTPEPPVRGRP
jgi:hypothetical protein